MARQRSGLVASKLLQVAIFSKTGREEDGAPTDDSPREMGRLTSSGDRRQILVSLQRLMSSMDLAEQLLRSGGIDGGRATPSSSCNSINCSRLARRLS